MPSSTSTTRSWAGRVSASTIPAPRAPAAAARRSRCNIASGRGAGWKPAFARGRLEACPTATEGPPMPDATHFEVLGLPRRFALDPHEVEANYLRQSREIHPDYHQLGAASEQRASLELTARLNEAHRILRDPFRRAEYLLEVEGGPSAAEHREMSPAFLEEMLELRMQIEELRQEGVRSSAELDSLECQLQGRRERLV